MASEEHRRLASFIKGVHQALREDSRLLGPHESWRKHCSDLPTLRRYAEAMRELATEHWEKRSGGEASLCRIGWVLERSEEYFRRGGAGEEAEKEAVWAERLGLGTSAPPLVDTDPPTLLDVGSCYNPFGCRSGAYTGGVTAVDLEAGGEGVLRCDFLQVALGQSLRLHPSDPRRLLALPRDTYHAVVLSLVLEYLPTPAQRWECVEKCNAVLRKGGLLFIVTPDSKHATANAGLLKEWRRGLARLGLWRVYYEKLPHLHCMAFRKCRDARVAALRLRLPPSPAPLLSIPQDSNHPAPAPTAAPLTDSDRTRIALNFEDMPADYDFFL